MLTLGHGFRAGVAELDVTPHLGVRLAGGFQPVYAEDVHDPLYSKAVVLDNGKARVAFVAVDVISLSLSDVKHIRSLISQNAGVPEGNIMIGCTHTHTGPATQSIHEVDKEEAYVEWLKSRIADSATLAARRLRPAKIGWGRGEQKDIGFCRRFIMADGTVQTNPGRGNPDIVEPTSATDPTVGVLYVEDESGGPVAVIAQYGTHYVGTDDGKSISADYYGHFGVAIRKILGENCMPLLFNGAIGQVNNINPLEKDADRGHARGRRMAQLLSGEVLKVIGRMRMQSECDINVMTTDIELPRQTITEDDMKIARRIIDGDDSNSDQGPFSYVVGRPIPAARRLIYARHLLRLAEMPLHLSTEVQLIKVGESAWIGLPGQTFTEIALNIIANSPTENTFVVNLANDNLGYIATDKALLEEGSYETWAAPSNPVGVGGADITINAAIRLLKNLF